MLFPFRTRHSRRILIGSLLTVVWFSANAAAADWRFEADSGVVYDNNLSNSDRRSDMQDDWSWQSNVRASNGIQLTRDLRLNFGAEIAGQVWRQFYDFSNVRPGGWLGLRYRFGLGRTAPWVSLED